MSKPSLDRVQQVLSVRDRGLILRRGISRAWATVREKYGDAAWWRRKTTTAGLVWEYAVENVISGLEGDDGARTLPHDDTVSFILDDEVLVRLKRADLQLKSRNYPTLQALLFHDHAVDLFGHNGLQRVEAAYVLNRFQTDIDWIGVVARNGRRPLWNFELEERSAVIDMVPAAARKAGVAADRVMRPKPEADKAREDERE